MDLDKIAEAKRFLLSKTWKGKVMQRDTLVNLSFLVLNLVFAAILILTIAALVNERSQDIVRVTVPYDQVGPTAQTLQGITHKIAYAYPIGRDANAPIPSKWRVIIDRRSKPTN